MLTVPGLETLQARKRELLLESDVNRQILQLEAKQIRLVVQNWKQSYSWVPAAWTWAVPIAGFLMPQRFKKAKSLIATASMVWMFVRKLWQREAKQ